MTMTCREILRPCLLMSVAFASLMLAAPSAQSAVKPHALFSDATVLQADTKIPVWGTATSGEKVTVKFQGQEVSTLAADGKWSVDLEPMKANKAPTDMSIEGSNTITVKNVLIGEVWICSGQSNMQWAIKQSETPTEILAAAANPQIRLFTVERRGTADPQSELRRTATAGFWSECGPQTLGEFSAVAYHFGRELQKQLDVPVGLISSNVGGTPAEAWTSRETLLAAPETAGLIDKDPSRPPKSSALFNAMIKPLAPYAIRGAIWYQGESNAGRAYQYRTLFPAMINDWRSIWGQGEFPFLYVQLAPFKAKSADPIESDWAELREAQMLTLKEPNTAMIVITDVGDEADIHPKPKAPVGQRLALAARGVAYGEKIEYSGPLYTSMNVTGGKITVNFAHVGNGLDAKGGPLTGFSVAGNDRKFKNAYAEINGETVVVHSPEVAQPVAVRYGWANYPVVNLWNKDGLPASPFRTDDFPILTGPKSK
jgi:sialate O-acetylesterase